MTTRFKIINLRTKYKVENIQTGWFFTFDDTATVLFIKTHEGCTELLSGVHYLYDEKDKAYKAQEELGDQPAGYKADYFLQTQECKRVVEKIIIEQDVI
jgi:hypothetical protein